MNLIIFTGAPAAGKSTIAKQVARRLDIDRISKDGIKIIMFEERGFKNHDEKKKISLEAEKKMYTIIKEFISNNKDIIVDNNFKDFDIIREIISNSSQKCNVICFYFYADSKLLADRYNQRIKSGNRHPALYTLNCYPIIDGISKFHPVINENDVNRIQKKVTEPFWGNQIFKIDTNNVEENNDLILNEVLRSINDNMLKG